jgi:hypothetical protein
LKEDIEMRFGKAIGWGVVVAGVMVSGVTHAWSDTDSYGNKPFAIAQQNLNPTNDPDVQRGIDQRQEQERQRRIQECYDQRTAHMNPQPTGSQSVDIRRECEFGPSYGGIRG